MEYFLINEWYSYWYATLILSLLTAFNVVVWCGVAFVASVVYDIAKQVLVKWRKK